MITINGVELRNLEEQVRANKENIAKHWAVDRVLADFGIRIIGQTTRPPQLDGYVGEAYGDAYAVGTEAPYDIYIWTRADANSGHPNDYWFNIGPLAVVGPEGPQGIPGPVGPRGESTRWYYGSQDPTTARIPAEEGNFYYRTNGLVYGSVNLGLLGWAWQELNSLVGPQGPQGIQGIQGEVGPQGIQGIQGPQGDVGGFINIIGVVSNINQMQSPASLGNMSKAYLVGTAVPYDLWIQVGESSATAQWLNTGPLNVSTLVTVGGQYVNLWDSDTKVTRLTPESGDRVYYQNAQGTDGYLRMAVSPTASTLAYRTTGGQLRVGTATSNDAAVPLSQANSLISTAISNQTTETWTFALEDGSLVTKTVVVR